MDFKGTVPKPKTPKRYWKRNLAYIFKSKPKPKAK